VGGNPEVVYLHLDEEVYKFDLNGNRLYTFHSGVYPFSEAGFGGFAVAPNDGVLWMTHYWKDAIEGINPDGTSAASHLQSYSSGNGQFDRPSGLTVAIDGSLYVVDEKNFQVQKLQQRFGLPGPIGEARALETVNSCNRWTSPWIFWAILM
jgi:DNA-binding beta-propeller fold protein YncE